MKISLIAATCVAAKDMSSHRSARDALDVFAQTFPDGKAITSEKSSVEFEETSILNQLLLFYMSDKDFTKVHQFMTYGCWCQLRNEKVGGLLPGHGTPVDALDAACRAWQQCKTCVTTDNRCDSFSNVPYEVGFDPISNRIDCNQNPDGGCAMNVCKCDETLAFEMKQLFDTLNEDFITNADGSGFDPSSQCKFVGSNAGNNNNNNNNNGSGSNDNEVPAPAEFQCCGTYPERFMFNTQGGARSCCGEVTYSTSNHDCCPGGFLSQIGTCA